MLLGLLRLPLQPLSHVLEDLREVIIINVVSEPVQDVHLDEGLVLRKIDRILHVSFQFVVVCLPVHLLSKLALG